MADAYQSKVPKADRIMVILSVHLDDEKDVALGRAFCDSASVLYVLCEFIQQGKSSIFAYMVGKETFLPNTGLDIYL